MALETTGYQVAAQTITWAAGQSLDSLVDDEWTDLSDEIDNTTDKYTLVDIRVALGSAAFTGVDAVIEVYLVPTIDGANYPDWVGNVSTDQQQNNQFFVKTLTTTGTTAAQELAGGNIQVPPGRYKWGFRNRGNVTLAATGNTPQWRPHSFEDV